MPLQLFDERVPFLFAATQDSTWTPATIMHLVDTNPLATQRVDQILLSNSDTVTHTFTLIIFDGTISTYFATIAVPAGSGQAAVGPVDVIATVFGTVLPYATLQPGYGIYGKWEAAPASPHLVGWLVKGGLV